MQRVLAIAGAVGLMILIAAAVIFISPSADVTTDAGGNGDIAGASESRQLSTADGLKITEITTGQGPAVKLGDTIKVNYTGKLEDGTVFDSTDKAKEPATFELAEGSLIEGWTKGIPGMKVGGKRTLVIPPDLGYGPEGSGQIPANATLIFDIELLGIE